jgi:hypothetical protein
LRSMPMRPSYPTSKCSLLGRKRTGNAKCRRFARRGCRWIADDTYFAPRVESGLLTWVTSMWHLRERGPESARAYARRRAMQRLGRALPPMMLPLLSARRSSSGIATGRSLAAPNCRADACWRQEPDQTQATMMHAWKDPPIPCGAIAQRT